MKAIEQAISIVGSATRLARILGVSTQAVCFWRDGARGIPAERCPSIERATEGAVRCEDLRPDVDWGYLRQPLASSATAKESQHA
jgi:DNA-binding transcriptional regulator YdaS (Cro superfamily)